MVNSSLSFLPSIFRNTSEPLIPVNRCDTEPSGYVWSVFLPLTFEQWFSVDASERANEVLYVFFSWGMSIHHLFIFSTNLHFCEKLCYPTSHTFTKVVMWDRLTDVRIPFFGVFPSWKTFYNPRSLQSAYVGYSWCKHTEVRLCLLDITTSMLHFCQVLMCIKRQLSFDETQFVAQQWPIKLLTEYQEKPIRILTQFTYVVKLVGFAMAIICVINCFSYQQYTMLEFLKGYLYQESSWKDIYTTQWICIPTCCGSGTECTYLQHFDLYGC